MINTTTEHTVEPHPIRFPGEEIVVINRVTGFPAIGIVEDDFKIRIHASIDGYSGLFIASPYYWEVAWP